MPVFDPNSDTMLGIVFPPNLGYTITREIINPPPPQQPYSEVSITRLIRLRSTGAAGPELSIHIFSIHLYMSPPEEAPGNCRADHAWVDPIATLCGSLHIRHHADLFQHDVFGAVAMGNQIRFFRYEYHLQDVVELVQEGRVLEGGIHEREISRLWLFVREGEFG